MASWLRNALGLPKSNMNCGAVTFMTASQGDIVCPPLWRNASVASTRLNDDRHTLIAGNGPSGPVAVAKGEPHDMVANIVRPGGDQFAESPAILGEQGPRGFLEAFEIACHRRHEMIRRVPCGTMTVAIAVRAAPLSDHLSHRHRRPAGLAGKPVPVARQQRHFARHDAKLRPP